MLRIKASMVNEGVWMREMCILLLKSEINETNPNLECSGAQESETLGPMFVVLMGAYPRVTALY